MTHISLKNGDCKTIGFPSEPNQLLQVFPAKIKRLVFTLAIVTFLLLYVNNVAAGIRPSFDLDYSSRESTDIVVASEGAIIDGKFLVLETLKGELLRNDQIFIPDLAKFKSKLSGLVKWPFGMHGKVPYRYVSSPRMILFLKRQTPVKRSSGTTGGPWTRTWEPASIFNTMDVSVAWLEDDRSFAFIQLINPGPSELVEYGKSEFLLRESIRKILLVPSNIGKTCSIQATRELEVKELH